MRGDTRGRVPFAVVGILLLLSSSALAVTLAPRADPTTPPADAVADRTEAAAVSTLRDAVRTAAADAGNEPVIEPANTTYGRIIDHERPFRDALRLRIYLTVRDHYTRLERRHGDLVATASLPPTSNPRAAKRAIERVHVERGDGNGTSITVTVENVSVTVRRRGEVVNRERISPRVTVATPVLAVHERVSTFESRLDAPVTSPGLDQRVTVLVNGLAWARGYAQYHGAPIENVVSNRHLELITNAALLDVQQRTIGRSDADGWEALGRAVAKTGAQDLLAMSGRNSPALDRAITQYSVLPQSGAGAALAERAPDRDEPMTIAVNASADTAFLALFRNETLNRSLEDAYSVDARLVASVDRDAGGDSPTLSPPGPDWNRTNETTDRDVDVRSGDGPSLSAPSGWHEIDRFERRVVVTHRRAVTWRRGNETRTRETTWRERGSVSIAVVGRHAPDTLGPANPIEGAHASGSGPLGGPNYRGVRDRALRRLVEDRGGPDDLATVTLTGSLDRSPITLRVERPDGLYPYVYRDLTDLREEVRNRSITAERHRVGTFAVNPPARLLDRLETNRSELLDAPDTYDGVADRARVAARAAYLREVRASLRLRVMFRRNRTDAFASALDEADAGTLSDLQRSVAANLTRGVTDPGVLRGPGGPVRLRVDSAPSYLPRTEVTSEQVPAVDGSTYPLRVHNTNLLALPYADIASGLLDALLGGPDRVSLGTAARTLRADASITNGSTNDSVLPRRTVGQSVEHANDRLRTTVRTTLADRNVGGDEAARRAIVREALTPWQRPADLAMAFENGSAADRVVMVAAERAALSAPRADRLSLTLDRRIRQTLTETTVQPGQSAVDELRTAVQDRATQVLATAAQERVDGAVERVTDGRFSALPSGMPLAPVPGYWYATTNVWHVEIEGEYARFGVRANRGRPTTPGGEFVYVRDGDEVALDVDGDGHEERIGRSTRVDFSISTGVVVVVPPGPRGVGDVDGTMDEQSPGWPPPE